MKKKKRVEKSIGNLSDKGSRLVSGFTMPKEMSKWFDKLDEKYEYAPVMVKDKGCDRRMYGRAMKSRDCTVVIFPHHNCTTQFKHIVNALRMEVE